MQVSYSQRDLPPGQRELSEFPRFGIVEFARRPLTCRDIRLKITGPFDQPLILTATELAALPRISLTADFHCAAGWSHRAVKWGGFRFSDIWEQLILPHARPRSEIELVVLRCQDGYRTALPWSDLLAQEVLLADRLNDLPLTVEHGAPIRIVAPSHYGYKSAKHLDRIELRDNGAEYVPLLPRLLDHPRARVALEERGQWLPGSLLRYAFRPFIKPIIRKLKSLANSAS
ncbi:molybdopterin-dependent oxidoreductase [Steroidobacter sp. S1-65]|uniref:Molybdopterin-dependent oxidoreductase n=1 Tax=Steroidobacter gossypii TaxID=2805490 RepID=A0ABS1WRY4_9GAMM|nr:molybdopterin-dependent oxidoreductase [Steroidobacter gossypii]MBM0103737.1 molybdopterin-dependent oxidoreductase [Steroidobacter gossypii]